jgi:hypothetical protein
MLVQKNASMEYIRGLKVGDIYMDSIITSIRKKDRGFLIMTSNGNLYNAHLKTAYYNVFQTERHKKKHLKNQINDIYRLYGYTKLKLPKERHGKQPDLAVVERPSPEPSAPEAQ